MASRKSGLDSIIEQLDKARAEKTPFGVPIPETQEIQEGLNILNAPTQEQRREILKNKVSRALTQWARTKMGNDITKYIDDGLRYFMTLVLARRAVDESADPLKILQQTRFTIPLKLNRNPVFHVDPFEALREYQVILDRVKSIQRKKWGSRTNRAMAIMEVLPGVTWKDAWEYSKPKAKASIIALDYVVWKLELPIRREALKKYFRLARNPEMMMDRIIQDFEQRSGYPQKSVKTPHQT